MQAKFTIGIKNMLKSEITRKSEMELPIEVELAVTQTLIDGN